jgi:hypothetical protein
MEYSWMAVKYEWYVLTIEFGDDIGISYQNIFNILILNELGYVPRY